jgi:hypothetical protein
MMVAWGIYPVRSFTQVVDPEVVFARNSLTTPAPTQLDHAVVPCRLSWQLERTWEL